MHNNVKNQDKQSYEIHEWFEYVIQVCVGFILFFNFCMHVCDKLSLFLLAFVLVNNNKWLSASLHGW